jgi:hypothetical protein
MAGCGCVRCARTRPSCSGREGHLTRRSQSRSHASWSGFGSFNSDPIHRTIPHRFCPELPILGARSLSPDSALCRARSPTHRRHSVVLTLGTPMYPPSAPHPSLTTAPTTPSSLTFGLTPSTLAPKTPRGSTPCVHPRGYRLAGAPSPQLRPSIGKEVLTTAGPACALVLKLNLA